ncbi:MAG: hypothetical protein LBE18_05195, partial [Planctomycetaceae bacterium]|nr:hypothetical protein [Planctomycetaceae bacterium]
FSVEDIVGIAHSKNFSTSYGYVYKLLKDEGFARLPRRSALDRNKLELPLMKAPVAHNIKI